MRIVEDNYNGTVFVADGYCNNRIAVFDSAGRYMGQFGAQGKKFGAQEHGERSSGHKV